jgi:hypothetical protein
VPVYLCCCSLSWQAHLHQTLDIWKLLIGHFRVQCH